MGTLRGLAVIGGYHRGGFDDDLPTALEQVTRLGLKKLARILRVPLDPTDGNLVRSQVTAALGAIHAQLRADEQQLRRKAKADVLDRLEKLLREQEKIVPPEPIQQAKAEASVVASRGDGSEEV